MSEQRQFPANWLIAQDYNPNDHLMNLKGKEYLNVQDRLLWFIRDQRALIAAGLATCSYVVRTEEVEHDREAKWANYRTYVRDVLGNESTMYGSESVKDFADYAEKASTKSLGRALLCLGYGAGMAPELDEGERVVDSPQTPRQQRPAPQQQQQQQAAHPPQAPQSRPANVRDLGAQPASAEDQRELAAHLGEHYRGVPRDEAMAHAAALIRHQIGGRDGVTITALKAGQAQITLDEVRAVLAALGNGNGKAGAA